MASYEPYKGYSNVTGGGFETTNDSRAGTSESNSEIKITTCIPVTIKQILESVQEFQDGAFMAHGQALTYVSFVGVIRNIADHTSNIIITLEDGTGQIEVRKWSENPNDLNAASQGVDNANTGSSGSQIAQDYQIGTYVKVHGALKDFGGKKNIQYSVVSPIESYNEILTHHLETIKWHAIALGKLPNPVTQDTSATDSSNGQSLFVKDSDTGTNNNANNASSNNSNAALDAILDFCRKECAGKDANHFALPVQLMASSLDIDEATVRSCCNTLTEQGFIYPTFDDDNYFAL